MDEIMLMRTFAQYGYIAATQARIEAMKAANQIRIQNGEALAYTEKDFEREANEIAAIASVLDGMWR